MRVLPSGGFWATCFLTFFGGLTFTTGFGSGVDLTFSGFIAFFGLSFSGFMLLCSFTFSTISDLSFSWKYFSEKGRADFLTFVSSNLRVEKRFRAWRRELTDCLPKRTPFSPSIT